MKRRPLTHAELLARMPRAFRPKLRHDQVRDLAMVHLVNLDAIAHGQGTPDLLRDVVESIFTWSRVAELLQAGVPEMRAQLEMAEQLIERFKRTGRVGFNGAEYQLAKDGIGYMDQLAEIVDQRTAIEAADWSEHHLAGLRHGANPCTCATPSGPDYCPEHAA